MGRMDGVMEGGREEGLRRVPNSLCKYLRQRRFEPDTKLDFE